jgi:hypothetical protein
MLNIRGTGIAARALFQVCVPFLAAGLLVAQQPGPPPAGVTQAPAPSLSPQQLDTLVAPVALYPDRLLGQILPASTYPLEIAEASQWVQHNSNLQGSQLVEAARQQNWDPSVQAMVVFPDVLNRLSSDIRWTTDLGNAFLAQQADVMNAIQRMRAQAQASGKLRSNDQQTVTTEMQGDQSAIDIQPANPEVVYVPMYNPQYIWGPPAYGYYPPWDYLDIGYGVGYGFGPGIYIGGFFGGLGWGGWGWGPNWFGRSIFQNAFFFNHYGYRLGFGFGGGRGYVGRQVWAHDPGHRLGVTYPNRALNNRYAARSTASARTSYALSRAGASPRANAAQTGGWNHFGQAGSPRQGAPSNASGRTQSGNYGGNHGVPAYRSNPSIGNNNGYRASPSYGGAGNRSVPAYRYGSSPGNNGGYRASPSYGGVSGGNRSVPSYRSSPPAHSGGHPSYSGGGSSRSVGASHSGGGGGHVGGGHVGGGRR